MDEPDDADDPEDVDDRELERRRAYSNHELLAALESDDPDERGYAFEIIAKGVPQSGAFAYRRTWTDDELQQVRQVLLPIVDDRSQAPITRGQALYALTRLGLHDPELVRVVQRAFRDKHESLRTEAIRAFPEDRELVIAALGAHIVGALDDPSADVVWTAVHRLGELPELGGLVAHRILQLLDGPDSLALAAAYTLNHFVEHGVLTRSEVVAHVEGRPLTSCGVFLVCSLLQAASDAFLERAACGDPAVARTALQQLADLGEARLSRALDLLRARNPRGFEALLDEALTEDDDYRALARGCEDVWSAALRPQLAAVEPAVAAKIRDLLARWAESS